MVDRLGFGQTYIQGLVQPLANWATLNRYLTSLNLGIVNVITYVLRASFRDYIK